MSLPAAIISGSYQSASSVIDAFEAYRRAQVQHSDFVAGSLSSSSGQSGTPDSESAFQADDEEDEEELLIEEAPRSVRERERSSSGDDALLANIQWDEDLTPGASTVGRRFDFPIPPGTRPRYTASPYSDDAPTPRGGERTPLIVRQPTISTATVIGRPTAPEPAQEGPHYAAIQRRVSRVSVRSKAEPKVHHGGQSTFAQTLVNAVAVLFGIGMLSEPLAFAYAGWLGGSFIILSYGFISCYTAKILASIVLSDPHIRSYSDIGRKAFGPRSSPFISVIFGLELFTVCVALVTLYADSLYAVIPSYSPNTYKLVGLVILIPAVLMPLSVLSYASILGIFSLMAIIGIILFDGFTKFDSPGSLWAPADTSLGIDNYREVGIAFGLFMAGFSGHAVIPTLARDMIDPSRFDEMINWAFAIATGIYAVLGVAGYIMFGNSVSDEFSQDLIKHNVHPSLNTIALWGLVITPLSKFALAARPLNVTLEVILGIDTSGVAPSSTSDHGHGPSTTTPNGFPIAPSPLRKSPPAVKAALIALERSVLTLLAVAVSILVPEFASVMAVLGSTFSFVLCVIGPVSAKVALAGAGGGVGGGWWRRCQWWDGLLLVVSASMAVWGTICAFTTVAPVP
ncbi:Vacuolar amino acid transporter 1 [Trametes pubescens]|uniref:Vacuolar amino acid transporter 1 n=1 Tax=Trametes pubescens TaxID=154538 RepID=A0A1M2VWB2_TRAPU|nr:Vacuolar amino acid transporter 1 [Trametes pubescens]